MTNEEAIIDLNALKFILDNDQYTDEIEEALDAAISALQQPEIVRCRECKHYRALHDQDDLCVYTMTSVTTDDYCGYAERKEGADR